MDSHRDLNNLLKEQKDVLLGTYQENRTHVRHLEAQRATASNIIILTTIGLIGLMANGDLNCKDWPLSIALIVLGVYGAMFTAIHFECIRHYRRRARECFKSMEVLLFKGEQSDGGQSQRVFENIQSIDDCEHEERFPALRGLPFLTKVRAIWPLTISVGGMIVLLWLALFSRCYG